MFQCLRPAVAVSIGINPDTGKKKIRFISDTELTQVTLNDLKLKYGEDNTFVLPCGRCESCRRNYAEDWAIRCTLEAQYHRYNYFLTLTYSDEFIKYADYSDFQKFLKLLRKRGFSLKYFACSELGEETGRFHFHCVIMSDQEIDLWNPVFLHGNYHYHSKLIGQCWKYGLHDITPFESTCARYVAKYTSKDGHIYMSRNLAKQYWYDHFQEIINDNFKIYADFGGKYCVDIPRCFSRWYKEIADVLPDMTEFNEYLRNKKSLGHLYSMYKQRGLCCPFEDLVIYNDKMQIVSHLGGSNRGSI